MSKRTICRPIAAILAVVMVLMLFGGVPMRAAAEGTTYVLDATADLTAFAAGAKADGDISFKDEGVKSGLTTGDNLKPRGTQDPARYLNKSSFYWSGSASVNTDGAQITADDFVSLEFTGVAWNADGTIDLQGFLELDRPFADVRMGEYYYDAVLWAVENEVTSGTGPDTFSPGAACLRAQAVTFLWRAAGSPAPTITENPFVDVKESDYFYKAVLWALEKGITSGVDATHFAPAGVCSRAEALTFLWRAKGSSEPAAIGNPFVDVKESDYFCKAVLWACGAGVTTGMDENHFAPEGVCIRAHVVTFLYKAFA